MIAHTIILSLLIGLILDSIFGDPQRMPHPIRIFGRFISIADKCLNRASSRKIKGGFLVLSSLSVLFISLFFLMELIQSFNSSLYLIISSIFVFYGIANHSLIKESLKVEYAVNNGSIKEARQALSMIVGRDTSQLSKQQIRQAVLETLSENLSDGVIAPLFYYAIAGVPGIMTYKLANTFDSMIAYKNDTYRDFGFFAAKIDDVLNYIPARITALCMILVSLNFGAIQFVLKYADKHSSPNSGYPESALVGILDLRLGGPNIYHGNLVEKPYIGENTREILHKDVLYACFINGAVTVLKLTIISLLYYVLS